MCVSKPDGWNFPDLFQNFWNFLLKKWTLNVNLCWTKLNLIFFQKKTRLNVSWNTMAMRMPLSRLSLPDFSGSIHLHKLYGWKNPLGKKNNNYYFNFIQICELGTQKFYQIKPEKSDGKSYRLQFPNLNFSKSFWEASLRSNRKKQRFGCYNFPKGDDYKNISPMCERKGFHKAVHSCDLQIRSWFRIMS